MRQRAGTAVQLSPIARQQRALAGLGFLGVGAPNIPIGQGAGKGAESGAVSGASLGTTIMPGIGTAIGAVVGAVAGAIAGAIGKQDPEIQNFNQGIAIWQQNPDAVYQLANKYLVLAGFFDLTPQQAGRIRIYRKYGRMGEEPFTRDLTAQVYQAAQSGKITPQDSAVSVYQKVILPWEDSWGFGPEPSNPHSDFMDRLLTGLIFDYVTGYGPAHWFSRSGPLPASFSSIPPFQFPVAAAAPVSPTTAAPASAAAFPPFPGWSSATLPSDPRLTVPWTEHENGYTATFTPVPGSNNLYTANFPGGTEQFQWAISGNQVLGLRKSAAGWGKYTGTIAPDGVTVSGSVLWYDAAHAAGWTFPFDAVIQAPAALPAPSPPATSTVASVPTPVLPPPVSAPPVTSAPPSIAPPSTAVNVPAGFTLVGTANNLQAYLGPDGLYYSWSGTTMTPLTGTLVGLNGQAANVISGQIQALAPVTSTTQALPPVYTPPPDYSQAAAPQQFPQPVPSTASSGIPSWAWLAAGLAGVYLLSGRRHA